MAMNLLYVSQCRHDASDGLKSLSFFISYVHLVRFSVCMSSKQQKRRLLCRTLPESLLHLLLELQRGRDHMRD